MIYAIFFPTADLDLLRRALTVAEGLAESLEIAASFFQPSLGLPDPFVHRTIERGQSHIGRQRVRVDRSRVVDGDLGSTRVA